MGLFRPSRKPTDEPDPWLEVKLLLFAAGALMAFVGMATRRSWLVWLAFVPLAIAFLLRFARRGRGDEDRAS